MTTSSYAIMASCDMITTTSRGHTTTSTDATRRGGEGGGSDRRCFSYTLLCMLP